MAISEGDAAEILKAAMALAMADGKISASERALVKAVAQRAGVAYDALEKMVKQAGDDPAHSRQLFQKAIADPERAMQLLVAAAIIDGRISEPESRLLVEVSEALGISAMRFNELFQAGMMSAKRVRSTPDKPDSHSKSAGW